MITKKQLQKYINMVKQDTEVVVIDNTNNQIQRQIAFIEVYKNNGGVEYLEIRIN